jgi:hypothetical protein
MTVTGTLKLEPSKTTRVVDSVTNVGALDRMVTSTGPVGWLPSDRLYVAIPREPGVAVPASALSEPLPPTSFSTASADADTRSDGASWSSSVSPSVTDLLNDC